VFRQLRKVRKQDVILSRILQVMSVQAFMAEQSGEITEEAGDALLAVFHRTSNYIMADRSVWERQWQKRYNARRKHRFNWGADWVITTTVLVTYFVLCALSWWIFL